MSGSNGHLGKDGLLSSKRRIAEVDLPSGAGKVWIQAMSGAERDELEAAFAARGESTAGMRGVMAALSLCDESGVRLFETADAPQLSANLDAVDLEAIVEASRRLSRIGQTELAEVSKN